MLKTMGNKKVNNIECLEWENYVIAQKYPVLARNSKTIAQNNMK